MIRIEAGTSLPNHCAWCGSPETVDYISPPPGAVEPCRKCNTCQVRYTIRDEECRVPLVVPKEDPGPVFIGTMWDRQVDDEFEEALADVPNGDPDGRRRAARLSLRMRGMR